MAVAIVSACFMAFTVFSAQVFVEGESLWSPPEQGQARREAKRLKSGGAEQVAADPSWRTWAVQAAEALKGRLGVEVAADDLCVKSVSPDGVGNVHVRLAQQYKGVPVRGNQLIVHFRASGTAYVVNGDFLPGIELDVTPAVPRPSGGTLMVWTPSGASDASSARLAWRIPQGVKWMYQDARSGEMFAEERRSRRADSDEEYDEEWLYDYIMAYAPKARTSPFPAGVPCMIRGQLPRPLWTNDAPCVVEVPGIKGDDGYYYLCGTNGNGGEFAIWNAEGVTDVYRSAPDRVAPQPTEGDVNVFARYSSDDWGDFHPEAIAAARHLVAVMGYYHGEFGRATYLGTNNVRTCAFVCLPEKGAKGKVVGGYDNAFFISDVDGSEPSAEPLNSGAMYFGYDSSGATSFQALDVTAHEFSHGIASSTADFLYEGESGALDESFADIFGVGCENLYQPSGPDYPSFSPQSADWFMGEDIGYEMPLRDLVNPSSSSVAYPQPSVYRDAHWADTTPYSEDQGGVHSNSGVQNRFFYLLQKEIGLRPALQIAYHVVTRYCSPQTGYAEVARLWSTAAADLAGRTVNGVEIPASAASAAASCWEGLIAKPAYVTGGKRVFIGYSIESGIIVEMDIGEERKGRLPISVAMINFNTMKDYYDVGTIALDGGKARFPSSLGSMELDFAADNITCTWTRNGRVKVDKDTPSVVSFVVFHRTPEFLPVLDGKIAGASFCGVEMHLDLQNFLSAFWGDYLTFSASGLPAGIRLGAESGILSGVPAKAQKGTAQITVKSVFTGLSCKYSWNYSFSELPPWAKGGYGAYVVDEGTNKVGDISMKVSAAGVISGRMRIGKSSWNMSAKGYTFTSDDGGVFYVYGTPRSNGVDAEVLAAVEDGMMSGVAVVDGVEYSFSGGAELSLGLDAERLPGQEVYLLPAGVQIDVGLVVTSDSPYTVTTKNLPAGVKLAKDGDGYRLTGKATKPGELAAPAQFTVKNYAVTGGRDFAVRLLVDNYHAQSIPIDDHYDDMIAGVPAEFCIPGAVNCAVKGLPPGLTFDREAGIVAGVPRAPGKHLVTFTRSVREEGRTESHIATALFVVYQGTGFDPGRPGVIFDGLEVRAEGASINGSGPLPQDISEGARIGIYAGVPQTVPISVLGGLDGAPETVKCSRLPAGLKFSKGIISGVASKPGEVCKVTVSASNKWKWSGSRTFTFEVLPLPEWAVGAFDGVVLGGPSAQGGGMEPQAERPVGIVALSMAANGKISGKMLEGGRTWSLSAPSFASVESGVPDAEEPRLRAVVVGKCGKDVATNEVVVVAGALDACSCRAGIVSCGAWTAFQNMWKRADAKSAMPVFKKKVDLALPNGVKVTFKSGGAVSFSGRIDGVSVSGSSQLAWNSTGGEEGWSVTLYAPPKRMFEGWCETIRVVLETDDSGVVAAVLAAVEGDGD